MKSGKILNIDKHPNFRYSIPTKYYKKKKEKKGPCAGQFPRRVRWDGFI